MSRLPEQTVREKLPSKCPCIPLHGDGGGEIDPAAVGDGREGVEDRLVDVGEGPGLGEVEDGLDLDGGHGVDDERAEEEDDVVDGEGDEEDVEGVPLHFPEGSNKSPAHPSRSNPAGGDQDGGFVTKNSVRRFHPSRQAIAPIIYISFFCYRGVFFTKYKILIRKVEVKEIGATHK